MRHVLTTMSSVLRWTGRQLGRIVNDSPPSPHPPMSNYMPNSNGEGGTVISSGHPGGH